MKDKKGKVGKYTIRSRRVFFVKAKNMIDADDHNQNNKNNNGNNARGMS